MSNKKKSYPYPILGEGDDIEGGFHPEFWVTHRPTIIEAEYKFDLKNETIEKLIKAKKAELVIEMECKTTFFRQTFATNELEGRIDLPSDRLREKVDVGFFICATDKISGYRPSGLHPDYGNNTFDVQPGDILADGGRCSFSADKIFDPLNAPASSFIKIGKGKAKRGPMILDYEGDYLTIELSEEDHARFLQTKEMATVHSLHAMLVLPALSEALHCFTDKKKEEDYGDKKWYERLQAICREQKIDFTDPLEAAQKILVNPVARGLSEILSLTSNDDE